MNILPKKRWHVRTKENIARVRRDEAKALEEEKDRQERIQLAEREARRELLLKKSRSSTGFSSLDSKIKDESNDNKHINFFEELEEGTAEIKHVNEEHEKEKKEEKEKYEKQIGYLTYLGQDTNEALGKKSWYNVVPDRSEVKSEVNLKAKVRDDPLQIMKKYTQEIDKKVKSEQGASSSRTEPELIHRKQSEIEKAKHHTPKKYNKHKKRKRSNSSESSDDECNLRRMEKQKELELLRMKRLKRENEERMKTDALLSKLNKKEEKNESPKNVNNFKVKYNTQFNPYLAKQNYHQ